MSRLSHAAMNSLRGLAYAVRHESAFRRELSLLAMALPVGLVLAPSAAWYTAMMTVLLATMAVELLNTCIELLSDHVTPEWNQRIGEIKDVGSAAVFLGISASIFVWCTAVFLKFQHVMF